MLVFRGVNYMYKLCFTASNIGRMNDPIWSAKWVVETTNTSVSFSNPYTLNLVFKSLLSGVTNMSPLKVARTISWFCFSRGGHSLFGHDFQNVYHQRLIITDTLNQSAQVADACLNVFTCWGVGESLLKAQQARCVCVSGVCWEGLQKRHPKRLFVFLVTTCDDSFRHVEICWTKHRKVKGPCCKKLTSHPFFSAKLVVPNCLATQNFAKILGPSGGPQTFFFVLSLGRGLIPVVLQDWRHKNVTPCHTKWPAIVVCLAGYA